MPGTARLHEGPGLGHQQALVLAALTRSVGEERPLSLQLYAAQGHALLEAGASLLSALSFKELQPVQVIICQARSGANPASLANFLASSRCAAQPGIRSWRSCWHQAWQLCWPDSARRLS